MTEPSSDHNLHLDHEWLAGFRRGDRPALTRVFHAYLDTVLKALRAGVVVKVDGQPTQIAPRLAPHEEESLVQDVFVRAFSPRARASYDGLREYGGYLSTICRNLLIDRGRRARRDAVLMTVAGAIDELEDRRRSADPSGQLESKQLQQLIEAFHAGLGEQARGVYEARYLQGLSLREASRQLQLSIFHLRRLDAELRVELLGVLRQGGFLTETKVQVGDSVLRRRSRRPPTNDRETVPAPSSGEGPSGET